jgi:hypothetical protein
MSFLFAQPPLARLFPYPLNSSLQVEDSVVAEFIDELSEKTGIETDQAHQGVGALLSLLKEHLDPQAFEQVKQAIPGAQGMLAALEEKFAGSGLLNAVKAVASHFGGGSASASGGGGDDRLGALEGQLAGLGLTPDHLKSLLPKLHELVGDKLPPEVVEQIRQRFPEFDRAAE